MLLLPAASAAELPEVGPYDRVRIDVPGWPGALATSALGSVVLEAPAGVPGRVEEAPVVDEFVPVEAFEALQSRPMQNSRGGAGVKVAVFDVQWFQADAWSDELGDYQMQDCETQMSCDAEMDSFRPRYTWEEGSHGVACAQVVHDIAPEAELYLVRVNGLTTLENAAEWAGRNEIDVISMSMSFFNNSFHDGTGPLNEAASRATAAGSVFVTSAGNYATEHWDGPWSDPDLDDDMDFEWGSSYLPAWMGSGGSTIYLSWDEFDACGRTDLDLEVYAQDATLLGRSAERQGGDGGCSPVERASIDLDEAQWVYIRLVRAAGEAATRVAVFARGGEMWRTTGGSTADPGSNPSTFTVGAVKAVDYLDNGVESYSSVGPTHGGLAKPNIAGPDGLTTAVYGTEGFYGTSAATPAVAGAIALVLGEYPELTPQEAAERLAANAIDERWDWQSPDYQLGAGKARLWDPDALREGCGQGGSALFLLGLGGAWRRKKGATVRRRA